MTGFNANNHEPMGSREVLPAGEYLAILTATHRKQTKAKTGYYLNIEFQIIQEGEHKGRKLWTNLNLDNPNEQAVNIAMSELSSICRATGIMDLPDMWDLAAMNSKPITLPLGVKMNDFKGENENTIKGYDVSKATAGGFHVEPLTQSRPDESDNLPF